MQEGGREEEREGREGGKGGKGREGWSEEGGTWDVRQFWLRMFLCVYEIC